MKIAIGVAYDGTSYSGWQRQAGTKLTIQEKLESALACVADHTVSLYCAGRTDAGVHATGQVAHFETGSVRSERSWIRGVNTHLPDDINLRFAVPIDDDFHARFSAVRRSYSYVIDNSRLSPLSLNRSRASWVYMPLDVDLMQQGGDCLVGEHDFSSFRASECQAKSPIKTIYSLKLKRLGDYVVINISANAFLHHMVRNIAGVLIAIGTGKRSVGWCREVLAARDRKLGGVTANPSGLYLTGVGYPERYQLPELESGIILLS